MSENPFEMFRSTEDYVNWDRYDEQADKIDLPAIDRQRVKNGLSYFRSLMGEEFLKATAQTGHPFISILTNAAPRERIFLAELAEQLQSFETLENFQSLKERMSCRDPEKWAEGLSVLEVAARFHSVEFFVSFEPKVSVTQMSGKVTTKRPDIKINNEATSDEVFVEVSRLLVGEAQRKSRRTFDALFSVWNSLTWTFREDCEDHPFGKSILPYIRFYRTLDDNELETVARMLNEMGSLVLRTNSFAELSIKKVIDVGIAPPFDHEAVHEWAKARDLKQTPVEGPPIDTDEVARAIRKIFADDDKTAKKWQIPDDGPGVVVLDTNKNLILFTHDLRYVIGALEDSMLNEPKLNYIILTLTFTSPESAGTVLRGIGDHTIVRNSKTDGSIEYAIIIRNVMCMTPLSRDTEEKLGRAFGSTQP
jgi:hypothetical protein